MFKHVLLLLAMFLLFLFGCMKPVFGSDADAALVRVGLALDQKEIRLNISEIEGILDLSVSEPQSIMIPADQVLLTANDDLIALNSIPVSSGPIAIIPGQRMLNWDSHNYRGVFMIIARNSKLTLINSLSVEDYLRGVVPKEVVANWPIAVLKAQAIAARTYTIASLNKHRSNFFDLCPTIHCQVYGGADAEKPSTNLAITATEGKIMLFQGKIVSALYHSSSGGSTMDAADVWSSSVPYLKPVIDWDQNSPYAQWTRSLNWEELQGLTMNVYPKIGRLKLIPSVIFGKDGKLHKVSLQGDLDEVTITGEQFRAVTGIPSVKTQIGIIYGPSPNLTLWWIRNNSYPEAVIANNEIPGLTADLLNPPWDLPDPWFWLQDKEPQKIVFKGVGFGHGVGMSQWGAKGMADAGYNEIQILERYYPGVSISDINSINNVGSKNPDVGP